ncbi:helix-turn-helix domain-containing protein [Bradyrhizobium canariense]|uniref:helix-turn-helix domain-containing protein n=1 Tax=Bradyrhizobium canariense TaxID=255045 RepID=UPI001B8A772F|nr:helix-turn-helix domain-containing protein [Bradyrhizobium canariense]MBR0954150.1 helix-turn-helix domain-containing protein [Bradyrhizobium canariense]
MGTRHPNPKSAKIHRTYSVEEIGRLFRVHKNTVRAWFRQGLKAIDGKRPTMARGDAIREFLSERRAQAKRPSGSGRIYCLPCRTPQVPALKMAECIVTSDTTGFLQGICPDCGRMIYRRVNPQKIGTVRGDLDVTFTQLGPRIVDTTEPSVNCDSGQGDQQ